MLHALETLIGASVSATDGEIGKVRNFLFDDQSWTIRYLVVDVGSWLKRRNVIVAVTAVEPPDWANKAFRVGLTREQVRNSPDVDAEKPVSRQQEIAMRDYFGWLAYWVDTELGASSIPTGMNYPVHSTEDPHLRSVWDLTGYEVWATDAEMGRPEGFILDDASWHLGYLNVKGGDWILSRSVLVPTRWVKSVSWANRRVNLLHGREEL
ncbi:MAG: PRC-barrel domain-containing protein [Terracidiphilus sp.]|jgi:hypothetical protein